ncbi:MAG: hypothetical protein IT378_20565 [Sandaracinaceae bacterium]|nr:hypothetical protein [Sandaracinaceae bacterium]
MGGSWIGYVFAIAGCGAFAALVAACTVALYAYARVRRARDPAIRVTSVSTPRSE